MVLSVLLLISGCGKVPGPVSGTETAVPAEQEQSTDMSKAEVCYSEWIMELETVRSRYDSDLQECSNGDISLIYLSEMNLWLANLKAVYQADFDDGEMKRLETVFSTDEVRWEYEYINGGTFEYIRYRNNAGDAVAAPLYVNCRNTLRYSRSEETAAPVCDWSDGVVELIYRDSLLYQIDREAGELTETGADLHWSLYEWLSGEMRREIEREQAKQRIDREYLESIIPEGYLLLLDDYASADFNRDGYDDYIMCLYPAEITEGMFDADTGERHWHIPEYQCSSFWIFWGTENGGHQGVQGPGIDRGVLTLFDIHAYDGGFELEYFVGRSPFEDEVIRYEYDSDKASFYKTETVFRDTGKTVISTPDNFGEEIFRIGEAAPADEAGEEVPALFSDEGRIKIEIAGVQDETDTVVVSYADKQKESAVMGLIDGVRTEMYDALNAYDGPKSGFIDHTVFYASPSIVTGQVAFHGDAGGGYKTLALSYAIDPATSERIRIKDCLTYDQMMELLRGGRAIVRESDEALFTEYLQSDIKMIELWETLDSSTALADHPDAYMTLDFFAEGVRLHLHDQNRTGKGIQIWIGKEQFRNTGLYRFWR